MRLKVAPGDFVVREELSYDEVVDGEFYVHVLRKQKMDTQQALARVAELAEVKREDIAFAGLKDRQGRTEQWISIRGRRLDHRESGLSVAYRGRTDRPISSEQSRGNQFKIVVRDLSRRELDTLLHNAESLARDALPNYFDDQRFGCLRHGQGFAMHALLRGDPEEALHRLIARPSPVAVTGDVKLKRILAERWGDWEACVKVARGPVYRPVLQHLVEREGDFRGALAKLPTRTLLIHAFAYQSYLWNRSVDRVLHRILPTGGGARSLLPTLSGTLLAWMTPRREQMRILQQLRTPLFGPEGAGGSPEFNAAVREILLGQGVRPQDFTEQAVPGMILREEPRALLLRPRNLRVLESGRDEENRGREMAALSFGLPRGSYATLVIKRLLAEPLRRPLPRAPRSRRGEGGPDRSLASSPDFQ
jgi:tRNA pseudouridine13 synthase